MLSNFLSWNTQNEKFHSVSLRLCCFHPIDDEFGNSHNFLKQENLDKNVSEFIISNFSVTNSVLSLGLSFTIY